MKTNKEIAAENLVRIETQRAQILQQAKDRGVNITVNIKPIQYYIEIINNNKET